MAETIVNPKAVEALNSKIANRDYTSGGMIDISSYNTSSNQYTTPTNGYVRVKSSGAVINIGSGGAEAYVTSYNDTVLIYVPAGTKLHIFSSDGTARFIPLY